MRMIETSLERLNPAHLPGALALAAVFLLIGMLLSWLVRRGLHELLTYGRSERINAISLSFLSRLLILALWLLLATLYAHLVPPLQRLSTALLAGVSLMSVIVGFAAQTTLGNLISGVSLILYKPFRRGDRLQVAAPTQDQFETGVVQDISLGFTVLKTDDGREIIIANGAMAQQTMIRLTNAPNDHGIPAHGPAPDGTDFTAADFPDGPPRRGPLPMARSE